MKIFLTKIYYFQSLLINGKNKRARELETTSR